MKVAAALLVIACGACVGAKTYVYHPDVVGLVDSESDKAIQVVSDERLAPHEPRQVPEAAVAAALLASGMFLDDDARTLATPIAAHLPTMQPDEALRIVAWSSNAPRYYYVYIHNAKLQVTYYAGSMHADDYAAVLPSEVTPIKAPDEPKPDPQQPIVVPAPAPDAGVVATAPPAPAPTVHHKHAAPAGYRPLSEDEARQKMRELEEAATAGLINQIEYKQKRKEILARL
jgi:hypothetical protein